MNLNDWPSEPRWDDTVCSEENYDAFYIGVDSKISTTTTGTFGFPTSTSTTSPTTATTLTQASGTSKVPQPTVTTDIQGLRAMLASQKTATDKPATPQARMAKPTETTIISGGGGGGPQADETPVEDSAKQKAPVKKNYNVLLITGAVAAILLIINK